MGKKSSVVFLERTMIASPAFARLTGAAQFVLLIFLGKRVMRKIKEGKRKTWVCVNNGKITFGWNEARDKWGLTFSRFSRALDQVVKYGFIDIAHAGGGCEGDASLYAISERWKDFGTDKFIEKERPRDRRGIGWRKSRKEIGGSKTQNEHGKSIEPPLTKTVEGPMRASKENERGSKHEKSMQKHGRG
jgi:hypothetical protein